MDAHIKREWINFPNSYDKKRNILFDDRIYITILAQTPSALTDLADLLFRSAIAFEFDAQYESQDYWEKWKKRDWPDCQNLTVQRIFEQASSWFVGFA